MPGKVWLKILKWTLEQFYFIHKSSLIFNKYLLNVNFLNKSEIYKNKVVSIYYQVGKLLKLPTWNTGRNK